MSQLDNNVRGAYEYCLQINSELNVSLLMPKLKELARCGFASRALDRVSASKVSTAHICIRFFSTHRKSIYLLALQRHIA